MTFDDLRQTLPMSRDVSVLSAPFCAGGLTFPNRLAIQAMEGADGTADGNPDELTLRRYERFAKSGAGLLWFEATAVRRDGRANPRQLWLHEKNVGAFKKLVADMRVWAREAGVEPVIIMQATHSGRYSKPEGVPAPLIAVNNPIFEGDSPWPADRIVSDGMLQAIEEDYARVTRLAAACGFDGIDIKACHRYLNNELLSAFTRPGPYGGAFENRSRFFRNCVAAARANAPSGFAVTARLNIFDAIPHPYGFGVRANAAGAPPEDVQWAEGDAVPDLTEPVRLVRSLALPFVNVTMGNPYFNPGVNRPVALSSVARVAELTRRFRAGVGIPVVSSAPTFLREFSPYLAAGEVEQGAADIVGYGRMAFAYPDFARDTLADAFDKRRTCVACGKCSELMRGSRAGCAVRDRVYTELYREMHDNPRRV